MVGAVLALLAFALVCTTNGLTVQWSFAALAVTLAYPFAKRYVAMPQAVLGVAFGFGIPMSFTAIQGQVPAMAWWLALGNLFWVLAYDTEYAMVDRDDDVRIGMRTSAITLGRWDGPAVVGFYVASLMLVGWQATQNHAVRTSFFWWAGMLLAAAQVVWHGWLIRDRSRDRCFAAFRLNHWLGLTWFIGLVIALA